MLREECHHSPLLPDEPCSFCISRPPTKLQDLCFDYINEHLEVICTRDPITGNFQLRDGLVLPMKVCERLLNMRSNGLTPLESNFVNIFRDINSTSLKKVKLRNNTLHDQDLEILLKHNLIELDVSLSPELTPNCFRYITEYGTYLQSLTVGVNMRFFERDDSISTNIILQAPNLRQLSLKNINVMESDFMSLLTPLSTLTHLDLSNCGAPQYFNYTEHLVNLTSLVLFNVDDIDIKIPSICKLKNLQHLDISQYSYRAKFVIYNECAYKLKTLVESLPKLTSLDLSGTNWAGETGSGIPGLDARVNNPFRFLGLFKTSGNACARPNIPAKSIAGTANEEQILVALQAYSERVEVLPEVFLEMRGVFNFSNCNYLGQVIYKILNVLSPHLHYPEIEWSLRLIIFYITIEEVVIDDPNVRHKIITTLLNAMTIHKNNYVVSKEYFKILMQFNIPEYNPFDYDRLIKVMVQTEDRFFEKKLNFFNDLSLDTEGWPKEKFGELGVIDRLIRLITKKIEEKNPYNSVLWESCTILWRMTDGTPYNCKKFIENGGMELFLSYLENFPEKDVLCSMMGLLGNVAEVKELRCHLMKSDYISALSNLLDSLREVSYRAAEVICHISSDGPQCWTIAEPSQRFVLNKMISTIDGWGLIVNSNIQYKSFKPILRLINVHHTPECQQWAVWALASLTTVDPNKYCPLKVEKDQGLGMLQELVYSPSSLNAAKNLAKVLENCRRFQERNL